MKNNFLIIFVITLFTLIISNKLLANDFTFETSTIEITDNGNIINAINGIAKSSDQNIEITADKFKYNKILSIMIATGNVEVLDLTKKTLFKSDNIFYNIKKKLIKSENKSSIRDKLNNIFFMDSFFYTLDDGIVKLNTLSGVDSKNNKLKLDKGYLNLNSNRLIGKDIHIDFNNLSFDKSNEPRLKGKTVSIDENETIITKGVFTTCKKNDKCPPWQITAKEVKHNKKKKIIYYKNAWIKLYDKPVFYFPSFFHPDPSVKRQSGFLMPKFTDSTSLGASLNVPYYHVISDNKDFTVTPRFYTDKKSIFQTEYRMVGENSDHLLDSSFLNDSKSSTKSHFFSQSVKKLNFTNFDESELAVQLQQTSNDTYLKTYKMKSPLINDVSLLTSSIGISAFREDLSFDVNMHAYENLNIESKDRYEFIYPSYNVSKQTNFNLGLNGDFSINSSGYLKNYQTNVYEKVMINDLIFKSNSKITNSGLKNDYNFLIKNINTDSTKSQNYKDDLDHSIASIFQFNSSYPLKKKMSNYQDILKPLISLKLSPNKTKNMRDQDKRIDINNIYNLNRIGENDSVEGGASVTYGIEFNRSNESEREVFGAKIANVLRPEKDDNLSNHSKLGQKTSDIVGGLEYNPSSIFKINYDFSLDENLNDTNYQLLNNELTVNNFINTFSYLNENNTINSESYFSNELAYKIDEEKKFMFQTRVNKKTSITEFYNLIYQYRNDCLIAALEYNKDYYDDRDLKPDESIFIKLTIMPFGETNSPNLKK